MNEQSDYEGTRHLTLCLLTNPPDGRVDGTLTATRSIADLSAPGEVRLIGLELSRSFELAYHD